MNDSELLVVGLLGLGIGLAMGTKTGRQVLSSALSGYSVAFVPAPHPCRHPILAQKKKGTPRCLVCNQEIPALPKGKVVK